MLPRLRDGTARILIPPHPAVGQQPTVVVWDRGVRSILVSKQGEVSERREGEGKNRKPPGIRERAVRNK